MPTSNNDNPYPSAPPTSPTLTRLSSHGSHNVSSVHEHGQEDSDAAFARQLQAEEDAIATQYEYEQRQRQQQPPRRDENNRRHDNENTRHDDLFDGEHYGTDRNDSNNYNALSQAGSFTPPAEETNRNRGIPGEMYPEPEPSIEVLAYPVFNGTLPYAEFDDEQLARRLEREMRDEQIARNLQEREQERHHRNPPLREGSSSRNRAAGLTSGTVHYQSRPPRRCGRSAVCSAGIMAIIIGSAAVLVVLFGSSIWTRLGGDPNDLPPYFDQDWGKGDGSATGDFSQWRNNKKGLNLKIRNALSSDWDVFFVKAVSDWNAAPSLALTTEDVAEEPGCANVRGLMKVCNDFYGKTGWTGLNEVYFEGTMIAASVAKMNEDYLSASGTSTAEKQYGELVNLDFPSSCSSCTWYTTFLSMLTSESNVP